MCYHLRPEISHLLFLIQHFHFPTTLSSPHPLKKSKTMHSPSLLHNSNLQLPKMEKASSLAWLEELNLPETTKSESIKSLYATIDQKWDPLHRTACQTAAGRALWNHVIHDPVADVLAGETFLTSLYEKMKNDLNSNAREVSGVILAVRTLWFDSKLQNAIDSFDSVDGATAQVVLLGAGMDARAYRLNCLKNCTVYEVDFPELLQVKARLIKEAMGISGQKSMKAKSLIRVAADIRETDWLDKLKNSGFIANRKTVWILEGILYYLRHNEAMQVLESISVHCRLANTVLLADFMNKSSVSLPHSTFHFYSDWPDMLLPTIGFEGVKVSQIGDPDARFGLLHDPQNLFDKLRNVPRGVHYHPDDGTPCRRLYLVEASGDPDQVVLK